MPNSNIYTVSGSVLANDGLYIPRVADEELLGLCRTGEYAYILTSRQAGKSSLMDKTVQELEMEGVRCVVIDLEGHGVQTEEGQWYYGLVVKIQEQLDLKTEVGKWWREHADLAMAQRLILFFKEVVLTEVESGQRVVVFVDEIDTTLGLRFTDDFFAAIRYMYGVRSRDAEFRRLSFVLIGVATPTDLISDPKRTPFNIGQRVHLTDFTFEEALPLADGLGLPPEDARPVLQHVLEWTGGHPCLTQRLCKAIADEGGQEWSDEDVQRITAATFFSVRSMEDDHLLFVRDMLTKRAGNLREGVLATYRDVLKSKHVTDEERSHVKSHLKLSGIVRREDGVLRVRNPIYRQVFNESFIEENIQTNWPRLAARAAAALVILIILVSAVLAPYAWTKKNEAESVNQQLERRNAEIRTLLASEQAARAEAEQRRGEAETVRRNLEAANVELTAAKEKIEKSFQNEQSARADAEAQRRLAEQRRTEAEDERQAALTARDMATESAKKERLAKEAADEAKSQALVALKTAEEAKQEAERQRLKAEAAREDAERLRKIARGGQLGAFAELVRNQQARLFKRSLLLAQESMDVAPSRVGYQSLTNGLALLPKSIASLPHASRVSNVAIGEDGLTLVTRDERGNAWLWTNTSGATGEAAFTRRGMRPGVIPPDIHSSTLSPSGRYLAELNEGSWRILEVRTGREVGRPRTAHHLHPVFSPDAESRYVATFDYENTVILEAGSLKPVSKLPLPFDGTLIFDLTGKRAAIMLTNDNTGGAENRGAEGAKQSLHIYDVASGRELAALDSVSGVGALFSPDETGKYFVTLSNGSSRAGRDGPAYAEVWDISTRKLTSRISHSRPINRVAFSPDGKYLGTASDDFTARVWEVESGRELAHLVHEGAVNDLAFNRNGQYLATASDDTTGRVWDWAAGSEISRGIHEKAVDGIYFDLRNDHVITIGEDNAVHVWEVSGDTSWVELVSGGDQQQRQGMATSPAGDYLAIAINDSLRLHYVDFEQQRPVIIKINDLRYQQLLFSSNGRYVGTFGLTDKEPVGAVQWWDTTTKQLLKWPEAPGAESVIAVGPGGKYLVRGTLSAKWKVASPMRVFERATGREVLKLESARPSSVADVDGAATEARSGAGARTPPPAFKLFSPYEVVRFSPDEKYLIANNEFQGGNMFRVFDLTAGHELTFPKETTTTVAAFSPRGDYLATDEGGAVKIRRLSTWGVSASLPKFDADITTIEFSDDGNYLAVAAGDVVSVWAARGGGWEDAVRLQSMTHEGGILKLAFTRDDQYLATASDDNTARVWEVNTGIEVARRPITVVNGVNLAFGPGDKYLIVTTTYEGHGLFTAHRWLWSPKELLNATCSRLAPSLTQADWQEYEKWHQGVLGDMPKKICPNLQTSPGLSPSASALPAPKINKSTQ